MFTGSRKTERMSVGKNIGQWFGAYYDKVLAFAVLLALAGSLAILAIRTGKDHATLGGFEDRLSRMRPAQPQAAQVEDGLYTQMLAAIEQPLAFRPAANRQFFVPERRVICWDCRKPIAYADAVCPYCAAQQPVDLTDLPDYDGDKDGMPDQWEKTHGFNPIHAADGVEDADGDGFTNVEEYKAGTHPRDKTSSPELVESKMVVAGIKSEPFQLQFKSVTRMGTGDESLRFQLNTQNNRTHFARLGDTVQGFKVVKFEPIEEVVKQNRMERKVDRSILTLERGGNLIKLVKGEDQLYTDFEAELHFVLDNQRFTVKRGASFDLREQRYTVIEIDNDRRFVVLKRNADNKRLTVKEAASVVANDVGSLGVEDARDDQDGENPQ